MWRLAVGLALLLGCGSTARADIVTYWTLVGVSFTGSGPATTEDATGSFQYDGTTGIVSDISVKIDGSITGPVDFTNGIVVSGGDIAFFTSANPSMFLTLDFSLNGPIVSPDPVIPDQSFLDINLGGNSLWKAPMNAGGELVAPEPSAIVVLCTFLGALAAATFLHRRRTPTPIEAA